MMRTSLLRSRVIVAALLLLAPGRAPAQADNEFVPCQVMPQLITRYDADLASLRIAYIVEYSPERRARFEKHDRDYLDKLSKIDFSSLSQECQVDYILFKRDREEQLRLSQAEREAVEKITKWFPFAEAIYDEERFRRDGSDIPDSKQIALRYTDMIKQIKALRAQLKTDESLNVLDIYTAGNIITGLQTALRSAYEFYNGYDPLYTWWVPLPYENLVRELSGYADDFGEQLVAGRLQMDDSGIVGKPVGREELIKLLRYDFIPYTPEELIDIAMKEFEWCDAEALKASREMGFGDDWKAAQEKVKETYVPAGGKPALIRRLFNESLDFIKAHDLATIDPLAVEVWGLRMMSPERQLVNPFFTGGTSISISYPTNTMEVEDRMMSMRGNNPHFSRATVHHESIVGHHYQRMMTNRYRTYRSFGTPFWTEGWALYWEFLLYDMDFPQSPEDRLGMLFWRMHRCARVIFSLNYHLGKWTPQECIDFLVDRVVFERANAEAEVRRSFGLRITPLYQLAYMMGGLQFSGLKRELVDSGKMPIKEFHDKVLTLNAMPVEMVRAILTEQPLDKNFKTSWKFYEQAPFWK
ncbi:X-Pro dipeptidyl-peptidase [Parapedobacter pyrenivorans]|uniref:X-Pro dipeptidyl-peptidase n=1 Tax=Parapedobacter pyrenivorans TaxID=1305674 RepID=A0A917HEF5_9SPHI|nr:DUF885 family protein [Parapedobacter pyrenivorans]GGG76316.1 X-Pro dipeptidyl-peptidase [Parapedobacter pyrenivorans]